MNVNQFKKRKMMKEIEGGEKDLAIKERTLTYNWIMYRLFG